MPGRQRKRVQLGIIVSRGTKKTIEDLARDSGRSQGQICEELIEKGLLFDTTLESMHVKLELLDVQLELLLAADVEAKWRAARYTPVHSPHGRIWYPPDYPGLQRSGFEEGKPGEPQPEPVEVPPPEPTSEQGAARNLRNLEERIARLEALAKEEQK